jgi:hypothetical protein
MSGSNTPILSTPQIIPNNMNSFNSTNQIYNNSSSIDQLFQQQQQQQSQNNDNIMTTATDDFDNFLFSDFDIDLPS